MVGHRYFGWIGGGGSGVVEICGGVYRSIEAWLGLGADPRGADCGVDAEVFRGLNGIMLIELWIFSILGGPPAGIIVQSFVGIARVSIQSYC